MPNAVYPGTFDPLTRGHEDLVRRAIRLFDGVIVAVADSAAKRPLFTLDERVEIAREAFADLPSVRVIGFTGLLMNGTERKYAGGVSATVITFSYPRRPARTSTFHGRDGCHSHEAENTPPLTSFRVVALAKKFMLPLPSMRACPALLRTTSLFMVFVASPVR